MKFESSFEIDGDLIIIDAIVAGPRKRLGQARSRHRLGLDYSGPEIAEACVRAGIRIALWPRTAAFYVSPMMKWVVAWLMVGLATPALGQPISKWGGKRAIASEGVHVSFSPDGPWLSAARAPGFWPLGILEVHDDTGARVQFVERASGVELVLYADRATLRSVALADAVLSPSVAAARRPFGDRSPGMMLEPGTDLGDVTPAADHLVKVHVQDFAEGGELRITGYVPAASVGTVYRERDPGRGVTHPRCQPAQGLQAARCAGRRGVRGQQEHRPGGRDDAPA
jgi:hypothetical protein